jgi:hypothetical protein
MEAGNAWKGNNAFVCCSSCCDDNDCHLTDTYLYSTDPSATTGELESFQTASFSSLNTVANQWGSAGERVWDLSIERRLHSG